MLDAKLADTEIIAQPPPGGREIRSRRELRETERAKDHRLYWNVIRSHEFKRTMKRIREMGDARLQLLCRKLGITFGGR